MEPKKILTKINKSVSLKCTAAVQEKTSVLWTKLTDGVLQDVGEFASQGDLIDNYMTSILTISSLKSTDGGTYTCSLVGYTDVTDTAALHVVGKF